MASCRVLGVRTGRATDRRGVLPLGTGARGGLDNASRRLSRRRHRCLRPIGEVKCVSATNRSFTGPMLRLSDAPTTPPRPHLPNDHPTQAFYPLPHPILELSPLRPQHTMIRPHLLFFRLTRPRDRHLASREGVHPVPACERDMAGRVVVLNRADQLAPSDTDDSGNGERIWLAWEARTRSHE